MTRGRPYPRDERPPGAQARRPDARLDLGPDRLCECYLMHVGILGGTGPLGPGLGLRLAVAGVAVTIGSRDACPRRRGGGGVARPVATVPGRDGAANDRPRPARSSWWPRPGTPWSPPVRPLASEAGGEVVVSVADALVKQGREMSALIPPRGSMAAAVQAELPSALVAAAGHHLPASELEDLDAMLGWTSSCARTTRRRPGRRRRSSSIPGLRPLDAGSLAQAGAIEAFTAVLVTVNIRHKAHSSLRLTGLDHP